MVSQRVSECLSSAVQSDLRNLPTYILNTRQVWTAAARLLTRSSRTSPITPVLSSLHWLPVRFRIQLKVLIFTYRSLHGLGHGYISDLLHLYITTRALRSLNQGLLAAPRARLRTKGSFEVVVPTLWNALPLDLRSAISAEAFKKVRVRWRQVKTGEDGPCLPTCCLK